jgi:hypothetical protein
MPNPSPEHLEAAVAVISGAGTEADPHPADFAALVVHCAGNAQLVAQFNHLTGCNLGQSAKRSGLDRMIDEAAGYSGETAAGMGAFTALCAARHAGDRRRPGGGER